MKTIPLAEFIDKVERKEIVDVFGQIVIGAEKRVYGLDYSYNFDRAKNGKICELVYAVLP
jgi:hypothetical protein